VVGAGSMEEVAGLMVGKVTTMTPLSDQLRGAVGENHKNSFRSIVRADDNI